MYNNPQATYKKKGSPDSEHILGKQLPASTQAERAILGNLLLNDEPITQVLELLVSDDFYVPAHKIIFEAMKLLVHDQQANNILALLENRQQNKQVYFHCLNISVSSFL